MTPYAVHIPACPALGFPFPRIVQAVHVEDALAEFDETLLAEGRDLKAELIAKLRVVFHGELLMLRNATWAGVDKPGYLGREVGEQTLAEYLVEARKLPPRRAVEPMNARWRG